MSNPKQIETSLLTEHLRYTPLTLLDDIINTVNELVNRAVDAAEEGLLAADPVTLGFAARAAAENRVPDTDGDGTPSYPEARAEIEEAVHKLETLLEANVDKNFDKLEIYVLRNVLTVPEDLVPWVRLGHYENLVIPPPATTSSQGQLPTPESLHLLRRKLQETRKLHTALQSEKARNEALLHQLRSLVSSPSASITPKTEHTSPSHNLSAINGRTDTRTQDAVIPPNAFAFLTETPSAKSLGVQPIPSIATSTATTTAQGPLTTTTAFTLSQLSALRSLLSSLRPKIATLPQASDVGSENAHERRAYIETQARRVLERMGVDVRDGGGAEGMGRRVLPEEVRALEGVVGAMSRGKEGVGDGDGDGMEE